MNLGSVAGGFRVDFRLTDDRGADVSAADYRGRHLLVYFGFTNCTVVCPATMAKLTDVLGRLGDRGQQLVPLFISVDPERDTPDVLRRHLTQRYPSFTGLTGTRAAVEAAKESFRVFSRSRVQDPDSGAYQVAHTAFTYLVDPDGVAVAHFTDSTEVATIVASVRAVLGGGAVVPNAAHHTDGNSNPCH